MNNQPVLHHPNTELRVKAQEVSIAQILSPEMQALVEEMKDTMELEKGVGLAATQIGKHIRLIIAETDNGAEAFFNPEIVKVSDKMVESDEGCLSVPGIFGIVMRHKHVKVRAVDIDGNRVEIKTGGLLSVIFQHEIDHLNGILFIDRAISTHKITPENADSII